PTSKNLVPIRLDIEIDSQRYKDAFTWNPSDLDSEVILFAKRTIKDLKLHPAFVTQIGGGSSSEWLRLRRELHLPSSLSRLSLSSCLSLSFTSLPLHDDGAMALLPFCRRRHLSLLPLFYLSSLLEPTSLKQRKRS
ncbi:hypothetical protein PIB30_105281, partial [Stylosanthes scabra]|nr:hypothetical protein [Stylosanthes scabra]